MTGSDHREDGMPDTMETVLTTDGEDGLAGGDDFAIRRDRILSAAAKDGYDTQGLEIAEDRAGRAALLLLATLASMRDRPNAARTLAAIRGRSAEIAAVWGPPAAPIEAQHIQRDKRLDAIYRHARFPGKPKTKRGLRGADAEGLVRLADAAMSKREQLEAEIERLKVDAQAARIANAVDTVREFARRYDLVLGMATDDPATATEDATAGTFKPSPAARRKALERAKSKAGRKAAQLN